MFLKRLVKGDSRLSESKTATNSDASLPEPITTRTMQRYLEDLAFEYIVKIKKQQRLSVHHRQRRIVWCKRYLNWTKDNWRKDESIFYVLKQKKNQGKIWHLEKEKLIAEC